MLPELRRYARDIAFYNIRLHKHVFVEYDSDMRHEGELLESPHAYHIKVRPQLDEEEKRRTVRHELGHAYMMEKRHSLDRFLRYGKVPSFYLNELFARNPSNCIPSIATSLTISASSLFFDTPYSVALPVLAVGLLFSDALHESLASYYGYKFSRVPFRRRNRR